MADITWPTSGGHAFYPEGYDESLEFDVELTVSRSGRVSTRSLPGARFLVSLAFPDTTMAYLTERRQLEAFLASLRGGADRLLLWNLLTPEPRGSMRGTVTLAASVVAGATTAQVTGGYALPNLVRNPSFEVDSNADGLADSWSSFSQGTAAGLTFGLSLTSPVHGVYRQRVDATNLGTTSADRVGLSNTVSGITGGLDYTFSAYLCWQAASSALGALYIDWRDAGGGIVGSANKTAISLSGTLIRSSLTAAAPATAVTASIYVYCHTRGVAGVATFDMDAVQFEQATAATAFVSGPTLLRGDRVSIAGRRVMLTADATANDAGTATLSFQPPLTAAASSGAAVTLVRPTTSYVLTSPVVVMPARGDKLPGFAVDLVEA